jgi:hypothetical protein
MSTRLITTTQVNCSKTCFVEKKNQNEENLRLKGLLKIKLNSTHVFLIMFLLMFSRQYVHVWAL